MSGGPINLVCPRCSGFIPNNEQPGAYPGALSRWDNSTELCSACGQDEAMLEFTARQEPHGGYMKTILHPVIGDRRWDNPPGI